MRRDGSWLERRALDVGRLRRTYWLAREPDGHDGTAPLLMLHGSAAASRRDQNPPGDGYCGVIIFGGSSCAQQKKSFDRCIRCAQALSELETDDYHPTEVLIMVEAKLAGTGHA